MVNVIQKYPLALIPCFEIKRNEQADVKNNFLVCIIY